MSASFFDTWGYCSSETWKGKDKGRIDGPIFIGLAPKPKKEAGRTWKEFNDFIKSHGVEAAVEQNLVSIKDYKKLKESVMLYNLNTAKHEERSELNNWWFTGRSGTGKTTGACKHSHENGWGEPYDKPLNKWWDGYCGDAAIILDDLDPSHKCLAHHIKRWADHKPFTCDYKGSMAKVRPQAVYITSQFTIEQIWKDDPEAVEALNRRFTVKHVYFDENFNPLLQPILKPRPNPTKMAHYTES